MKQPPVIGNPLAALGCWLVGVGMVPFGDRASDPASTRPRARDRVHWTQLDRPEQWASDPSADKLGCKK